MFDLFMEAIFIFRSIVIPVYMTGTLSVLLYFVSCSSTDKDRNFFYTDFSLLDSSNVYDGRKLSVILLRDQPQL